MNHGVPETEPATRIDEEAFLETATRGFREACLRQLAVQLDASGAAAAADPGRPPRQGSAMVCSVPGGSWVLGVGSDELGCLILTRMLFAMEVDELPVPRDVADALGEIVNVAAGVIKSLRGYGELKLGLPVYLDGSGHGPFAADAPRRTVRLGSEDGLSLEISVQWRPEPL